MPSTYTSSLRLTLPVTGENSGTWGDLVNTGITALVDSSIAGYASVTMTDADYTLSNANGAADDARKMMLNISGTITVARNIICPTASKLYFIKNSTTGGFALTLKTSAGSGISIPNGRSMVLLCNGTDVIDGLNYFTALNAASVGANNPGTGAFTTLSASSTVSGTGFSTYLASPPAIGGTAAAAGSFTALSYSTTLTGGTGIIAIGTNQIYKEAGGNIGIGKTTPGSKLDVLGTLRLSGATSGYVGLAPAAVAGSVTYTLPSVDGTSGQVLQTNGAATLSWVTGASDIAPAIVAVSGTTQTAVAKTQYILNNVAATTVTLPATPAVGDIVWVTPGNGLFTNVIARGGSNIMSLAEDMTINDPNVTVELRYINSTLGWRLV